MKITSLYALGLFFAAALGMTQTANAQFFVEPNVVYEQGKAKFSGGAGIIDFSGDLKGLGIGVRAGGHVHDIVFLGVDAMYNEPEFSSSLYSGKVRSFLAGVTGGVQTPYAGVRLWATFYPLGTFDQDKSQGLQMKFSEPEMWKLGAGVRVQSFSINLEYLNGKYKKSEVQNDESTFASFSSADAKRESWMLGVSFPFSL